VVVCMLVSMSVCVCLPVCSSVCKCACMCATVRLSVFALIVCLSSNTRTVCSRVPEDQAQIRQR